MTYLARFVCAGLVLAACNSDGPAPSDREVRDIADDEPRRADYIAASVGARDGHARDRFTAKEDVFLTTTAATALGNVDGGRDYFFRVVDARGEDVSRSDAACHRVHIGPRGTIETYYANGDIACPHSTALVAPAAHRAATVAVGLAPFGDAAAILDGVATYEVQLAPVERFTGFHAPTTVATFVLDLRVAAN